MSAMESWRPGRGLSVELNGNGVVGSVGRKMLTVSCELTTVVPSPVSEGVVLVEGVPLGGTLVDGVPLAGTLLEGEPLAGTVGDDDTVAG
jgi:hypothetical protein